MFNVIDSQDGNRIHGTFDDFSTALKMRDHLNQTWDSSRPNYPRFLVGQA